MPGSKVYGAPEATPDPDFERRLFPVSFFSRPSHFCSSSLTISQRGAFGGLLPGHRAMPLKRALSQLFCSEEEGEEDVRPAKRAVKSRGSVRDEVVTGPSVSAPSAAKGKGKGKAVQPPSGRVCLRCSKRVHLDGESTSRGVTVPAGFRCDLSSAFRKCSFCAHTHHDCEAVSLVSWLFEPADGFPRSLRGFWTLSRIWSLVRLSLSR